MFTEYDEYPRVYIYRRLVQAKLYIDTQFSMPLNLRSMAGEACFSRFHFIRLFSQVFGCTPRQYLMQVRIAHAKKYLAAGMSVHDSCYAVGFESVSSFVALFKRLEGCRPAAFQQRLLRRKASMRDQPLAFIPHCFAISNGWI